MRRAEPVPDRVWSQQLVQRGKSQGRPPPAVWAEFPLRFRPSSTSRVNYRAAWSRHGTKRVRNRAFPRRDCQRAAPCCRIRNQTADTLQQKNRLSASRSLLAEYGVYRAAARYVTALFDLGMSSQFHKEEKKGIHARWTPRTSGTPLFTVVVKIYQSVSIHESNCRLCSLGKCSKCLRAASASPACHRMASSIERARPSCINVGIRSLLIR